MHKLHLERIDANLAMGYLRQRCFKSLAVTVDTHPQLQTAIWCQPRRRLLETWHHWNAPALIDRRPVRTLLAENCKTDADARTAGLLALSTAHIT